MKKLNLKSLELSGHDLLQREQLKSVFGGYGGGNCKSCTTNSDCGSGVCASYSGPDCDKVECGCGKWCL